MRTKINCWGQRIKINSQQELVEFLIKNPFKTEKQICTELWSSERGKKHADLIRRALSKGKIGKVRVKIGTVNRIHYFVSSERQTYKY
jgi:uncharacterized membrane protein